MNLKVEENVCIGFNPYFERATEGQFWMNRQCGEDSLCDHLIIEDGVLAFCLAIVLAG